MRFRFATRLLALDNLELLKVRIFGEPRDFADLGLGGKLQLQHANNRLSTAKRLKIDRYCQRQRCQL